MFTPDFFNQGLGGDALFFCAQHDGRAVGVVGADIDHIVALHPMKAGPDVRLNVFNKMAQVNRTVGIGQGRGDKNLP